MREISVTRNIAANRSDVWAVLADYGAISTWNSGVKDSYITGDSADGVGAKRHCDLAPAGTLEETITEWVPESRLVISIDSATKIPVAHGLATFELDDEGDSTPMRLTYGYQPKGGPLAGLIGRFLDGQLTKGFTGFLEDLEKAAVSSSSS